MQPFFEEFDEVYHSVVPSLTMSSLMIPEEQLSRPILSQQPAALQPQVVQTQSPSLLQQQSQTPWLLEPQSQTLSLLQPQTQAPSLLQKPVQALSLQQGQDIEIGSTICENQFNVLINQLSSDDKQHIASCQSIHAIKQTLKVKLNNKMVSLLLNLNQ